MGGGERDMRKENRQAEEKQRPGWAGKNRGFQEEAVKMDLNFLCLSILERLFLLKKKKKKNTGC